jgi:PTS system N-acetylglucosamine-specific IIC component
MTAVSPTAGTSGRRRSPLAVLQRIGRSLMLPIAVLPAAALLLRLGQPDLLDIKVMAEAGAALFAALPLLFAVGVAIGFARKTDGSTALAAVVGYLVFDKVSMVMFASSSLADQVKEPGSPNPTGVLGGIVIGVVASVLYSRYYRVKLPTWLAFFGGRRFVPIITALAALLLGIVFGFVWPPIGQAINSFGEWLVGQGAAGAGIYGGVNRLLLPFGLHHIVNTLVWFVFGDFNGVHGEINRFFAGDPTAGSFLAGFFPIMMFALPAAAIAMWQEARPAQRKVVGGIMISAALTSLVTGVTEPIEFAFMFVAPILYGIHIVLTGASLALCAALGIKDGFGFSAGLIDYLLNFNKATKPLLLLLVGAVYAAVYYVVFRFVIRRFNLLTPGREPDAEDGDGETAVEAPAAGRA